MAMVEKLSGGKLEVNHCVFFKEIYLNMIKNSTFVHGNLPTTSSPLELKGDQVTLAIVASQKGLVLDTKDLIKLGKHVSQKYQALHGKKPEKHMQMHHGRAIPINTFFECDRALIEEAINELFDE